MAAFPKIFHLLRKQTSLDAFHMRDQNIKGEVNASLKFTTSYTRIINQSGLLRHPVFPTRFNGSISPINFVKPKTITSSFKESKNKNPAGLKKALKIILKKCSVAISPFMFSLINHWLLNAYFAVSFMATLIAPTTKQKMKMVSFLLGAGHISTLSTSNSVKIQKQLSSPYTIPGRIPQRPILADITKPTSSPNPILQSFNLPMTR